MAFRDRRRQTSTSTGSGSLVLDPPAAGFKALSDGFATSAPIPLALVGYNADSTLSGQWETGIWHLDGAGELVRDTTEDSSTGAAISWGSALIEVFVTPTAAELVRLFAAKENAGVAAGLIAALTLDSIGGFSAAGKVLAAAADAAAQRAALSLGSAALVATSAFDAAGAASGAVSAHEAASDPHAQYQRESEKGASTGYAGLDAGAKVPLVQLPTGATSSTVALGDAPAAAVTAHAAAVDPHGDRAYADGAAAAAVATHVAGGDPHAQYQLETGRGAANGYASLDASTKVPIAQLPTGTTGSTVATGDAPAAAVATHAALTTAHGISVYGATLVDDVDATAARTTLGLGSAATTASTDYAGATAFTTHTGLTSGAHGLSSYGLSIAGAVDAAAARTALGTEGLYFRIDATNGPITNTLVSSKSTPLVTAPTFTTASAVDMWISAASGAAGRGIFISSSTSSSGGDGLKIVGSSASLSGRTSVVVETGVTAVADRYALRVDGSGATALFRIAGGGQAHHGAGTDAAPGVSYLADPASGHRLPAVGELSAVISGVEKWRLTSTTETHQSAQVFVAGQTTEAAGSIAAKQTTATTLSADANDLALGGGSSFRISSDASRTVTGLTGGVDGRVLELTNVGANPVVLAHESASSAAANRVSVFSASALTIPAGGSVRLAYDATSSRWRVVALALALPATVADGSITTAKLGGDITAAGKALLDDADASAQRTTLGLPASATRTITHSTSAPSGGATGDIHFQIP